jgi:hypothetical protein
MKSRLSFRQSEKTGFWDYLSVPQFLWNLKSYSLHITHSSHLCDLVRAYWISGHFSAYWSYDLIKCDFQKIASGNFIIPGTHNYYLRNLKTIPWQIISTFKIWLSETQICCKFGLNLSSFITFWWKSTTLLIFELESPGLLHSGLIDVLLAVENQVSWNLVPVLIKWEKILIHWNSLKYSCLYLS